MAHAKTRNEKRRVDLEHPVIVPPDDIRSGSIRRPGNFAMNTTLGICQNYTADQLRNFVNSFRKNAPGQLVLFIADVNQSTVNWLKERQVTLVPCPSAVHPALLRFFIYKEYLRQNPCERVLLTDIRDVVIQDDIFAANLAEDTLHLFLEGTVVSIGNSNYNRRWILDAYGQKILDRMYHETISCCGVIYGQYEAVLAYLDLLCAEMQNVLERVAFFGLDQAVHNFLLYTGIFEKILTSKELGLEVHQNGDRVLTLGKVPSFVISNRGTMLNEHGQTVPVVHQYDRYPFLQFMVNAQFPDA